MNMKCGVGVVVGLGSCHSVTNASREHRTISRCLDPDKRIGSGTDREERHEVVAALVPALGPHAVWSTGVP